jgi:hypothetical protein
MSSAKGYIGRKAARATVRHSLHGTVSKARREPPRTATLIGLGTVLGLVLGFALARTIGSGKRQTNTPPPAPTAAPASAAAEGTPVPA